MVATFTAVQFAISKLTSYKGPLFMDKHGQSPICSANLLLVFFEMLEECKELFQQNLLVFYSIADLFPGRRFRTLLRMKKIMNNFTSHPYPLAHVKAWRAVFQGVLSAQQQIEKDGFAAAGWTEKHRSVAPSIDAGQML